VKSYRDQLKDLLSTEFGSYFLAEPNGVWNVSVRKQTSTRDFVKAESIIRYLELLPLVIEEYESEIARMKSRYYNSQLDEE
jgi:hypothetical protein